MTTTFDYLYMIQQQQNQSYCIDDSILDIDPLYDDLYSYHISPSLAPASEESEMFVDGLAEDLQKNLVKDVFFSPAVNVPSTSQTSDDNYSLISFNSSSSCSPIYQYKDNLVFSEASCRFLTEVMDQHSFLYGYDLCQPLLKAVEPQQVVNKITKKKPPVHKKRSLKKSTWEHNISSLDYLHSSENKPRSISSPYQTFTRQSIDWCRYCGTTEGVNWRPGPWGKRTLCNKHGCDYKGYGFACKLPRLDLTAFEHETIDRRQRPVLQLFCAHCHEQTSWEDNTLVFCDGCPKSYHQNCYHHGPKITESLISSDTPWYCTKDCKDTIKHKKVIVDLPRKKLPLMRTPKNALKSVLDYTQCI